MRLPWQMPLLSKMVLTKASCLSAIKERRKVIRYHRDQKLDDRCWLDHHLVWEMLDDSPEFPKHLPTYAKMMRICKNFFIWEQAEVPDLLPEDAITDRQKWNLDLCALNEHQLFWELVKIQKEIKIHRDIFDRPRTAEDHRRLYKLLPEKIPADFRLPLREDFLGDRKAPNAGCPSFWRSHEHCLKPCDLKTWGPCD